MRNAISVGILLSFATGYSEEVCHRCEVIRDYNAAHPENNYYYYEDYLSDQKKKAEAGKQEAAKKAVSQSDENQTADASKS